MSIPLIIAIIIGAAIAGFIVKYDRRIIKAGGDGAGFLWRHRGRVVTITIVGVMLLAMLVYFGFAAEVRAAKWERNHNTACFELRWIERGHTTRYPTNQDINVCSREWDRQPWYTRYGLLMVIDPPKGK